MGNDGDRLVEAVEEDHAVVQSEAQVRELAVVGRRTFEPLDVTDGVVAGVANRSAAKARQAGQVRGAVLAQTLFEKAQRVGMLELLDLPGGDVVDAYAAVP